ncbi:DUF202 domain-containing protein [Algoriphagus sp. A40]|uniref:DUF202 domain-containing protein n=1 Tax=Algoriphagus sp. A40 TaxID=1945863 RepID=UPI0009851802|nr:DUF202 domain-containing protein [Algoriphagus sp. A40]OOG70528.1 hypothetical protein B0E43_18180 [Algoriphagus sp. A40]
MAELLEEKSSENSEKKKAKKLIQLERTRTAFERLQLAWVRTALTILAIGVGVYEFFFNRLESGKKPLFEAFTGRELALVLYCISFTILILSLLQHRESMAKLKESYPESRYSVASLLSLILLLLALFLTSLLLWRAFNP